MIHMYHDLYPIMACVLVTGVSRASKSNLEPPFHRFCIGWNVALLWLPTGPYKNILVPCAEAGRPPL